MWVILISELENRLEKCGVVMVIDHKEAPLLCAEGLVGVQHRGQEFAGVGFKDRNRLTVIKGKGYVADVLTIDKLIKYQEARIANGQTRYRTYGDVTEEDAQPLIVHNIKIAGQEWDAALTHNGQINNYKKLRGQFSDYPYKSTSDSVIGIPLLQNSKEKTLEEAILDTLRQLDGAYCFGLHFLNKKTKEEVVIAARDPHGFRPFVLGKKKGAHIVASETLTLYFTDADFIRYIDPGELLVFRKGKQIESLSIAPIDYTPCLFEWIYFSHMSSLSMPPPGACKKPNHKEQLITYNTIREKMGRMVYNEIMKQNPEYKPDFISPLLLSGGSSANELTNISGWPIRYAFAMNPYRKKGSGGRTFIMHGRKTKKEAIKYKLNPVRDVISGSHILHKDDSIVDGNTSKVIVETCNENGAKRSDFATDSPLIVNDCYWGVDMKRTNLIARDAMKELGYSITDYHKSEKVKKEVVNKVAEMIGAKKLFVPPLEELLKIMPKGISYCTYCLGGPHPITKKN